MLFTFVFDPNQSLRFNQNRSLDRICLNLLLPACFPTALAACRHLRNNRTKSVGGPNARFGFNRKK